MFTPLQAEYVRNLICKRSEPVTESGCWIWTASSSHGYGDFRAFGKKHFIASRASFEAFNRPLIDGEHALHTCDVRACVNPKHLFAGTNLQNIQDSMAKGRRKGITRNRPSGLRYKCTAEGEARRQAGRDAYWAKWRAENAK